MAGARVAAALLLHKYTRETAAYHRVTGRLLAFQARIQKMDIAMQIEQKQIALQTARSTERIKKIQASASREQAAAVAGMEDHFTAMGLRDSTRDELNVAREQYHQISRHEDTSGVVCVHVCVWVCVFVDAFACVSLFLCLSLSMCVCIRMCMYV